MASIYPGKRCYKKVADMTEEEYLQHRIYLLAACPYVKKPRTSKYPGKNSNKRVADMGIEELKQHRIYAIAACSYVKKPRIRTSKYPGKPCKKKSIDMTEEERKQHRLYAKASSAAHRAPNRVEYISLHPGKKSRKLVADMTAHEHEQHKIYEKSVRNKMNIGTQAYKDKANKKSRDWRLKNPEKLKDIACRFEAKRLKDPIRYAKYLSRVKESDNRRTEELTDYYVRRILYRQTGIPAHEIPTDVVEQRRIKIVIERLIKLTN
jgi:hypothetical protein